MKNRRFALGLILCIYARLCSSDEYNGFWSYIAENWNFVSIYILGIYLIVKTI